MSVDRNVHCTDCCCAALVKTLLVFSLARRSNARRMFERRRLVRTISAEYLAENGSEPTSGWS